MNHLNGVTSGQQTRALTLSTAAFMACVAVWTIFSIVGIRIERDLGLNETEFGLLVGTPILTGSLSRLILGICADRYGGRLILTLVMLIAAAATFLLASASTYEQFLLAALGIGIAGGAFAAGVGYVSRWYPKEKQGTVLGIFGMGNIGAAATTFIAPFVMVALGWKAVAEIWAAVLAVMAIVFYLLAKEDPVMRSQAAGSMPQRSFRDQLEPFKHLQIWRFSFYYFSLYGSFLALTLWLPRYLMAVYELDITTAGMVAAAYALPASLFRVVGGVLSDKLGARTIMYLTFIICVACTFLLSYPSTDYVVHGVKGDIDFSFKIHLIAFIALIFGLGFFMALGQAAVFKHIPVYYPGNVGSVGGAVGMMGGLGGFVLPIAFGAMNDIIGVWTSCFMLLFGILMVSLAWMHLAIRRIEHDQLPQLSKLGETIEPVQIKK